MYAGPDYRNHSQSEKVTGLSCAKLDSLISDEIEKLENSGLDMHQWNAEYEVLPDEIGALETFYSKLQAFIEKRDEALSSIEFPSDISQEEREKIRHFDRSIMSSYRDYDNYLGNGATAEVYGMSSNDVICIKFITDQERYNENNHLRVEFERLSRVHEHTKVYKVRVPYPVFLRIHAKEGHSLGMEKIQGASLSQLLEQPLKYPELITAALNVDRVAMREGLLAFVAQMHECGVVHCDLYERNMMITSDGELRVIDFGKAKLLDFKGDREDERKSDVYNAQQSLRTFFERLDTLTKQDN